MVSSKMIIAVFILVACSVVTFAQEDIDCSTCRKLCYGFDLDRCNKTCVLCKFCSPKTAPPGTAVGHQCQQYCNGTTAEEKIDWCVAACEGAEQWCPICLQDCGL